MYINESPNPRSSLWNLIACMLRFYRTQRGESGAVLAELLNCARSSISRLENGDAKLTPKQAAKLDEAWNTGGLFGALVYYARVGHDPNWFQSFIEPLLRSSVVKAYNGQLLPGQLQTPEYARALFTTGRVRDIDAALKKRMSLQDPLRGPNPPELWILLAETTLLVHIGGKKVMHDQLGKLLEVSEMPNVILRVIANSAGSNLGLDGPFRVVTVKEGKLGFVEALNGGRLVTDIAEIADLEERFDRIGAVAEPVDSSRCLIKELMETYV
ncbi:helix-turn-helix transcriptional regulator [Actinomadura sp. DC4]|uniref:helix-turn-helix domain-containing protein n=1 Tax=Actinomadura sp. DC4 TaxID=3055069 RepID=UPI0025B25B5C|nr:helix-turn-helix transcriptional regulator [Actinomadura sp. DC4]MDN3357416.1 helix-turn-helix transcriptional regulator [Actinomadura sp. DC4]